VNTCVRGLSVNSAKTTASSRKQRKATIGGGLKTSRGSTRDSRSMTRMVGSQTRF
jgi:hypothetical protein